MTFSVGHHFLLSYRMRRLILDEFVPYKYVILNRMWKFDQPYVGPIPLPTNHGVKALKLTLYRLKLGKITVILFYSDTNLNKKLLPVIDK